MKLGNRPWSRPAGWRRPVVNRLTLQDLESRDVPSATLVAIGADAGGGPHVTVLDRATGELTQNFFAYDASFTGGVRVAVGDVTGDRVPNVVTAPGEGIEPLVRVFDGKTGDLVREFLAFDDGFTGGVNVAVGDVTGDRVMDIVVARDAGGTPDVRVFDGETGELVQEFLAFEEAFGGGVRVAVGDVTGDGKAEVVVGAGIGGGSAVRVIDGNSGEAITAFFAYEPEFTGGVFVAVADLTADGKADIVTGPGAGGGPRVNVFDGSNFELRSAFFAYEPEFTGGVRVGAFSLDATGRPNVLTAPGEGGGPDVRIFSTPDGKPAALFSAFTPDFRGGVFVGGSGLPPAITKMSNGTVGDLFDTTPTDGQRLVTVQLKPLDINLLGLEISTSPIEVVVSAEEGEGKLLGNLITVVSNLINLDGVNKALNNVLGNVVDLVNSAELSVDLGVVGGPLTSPETVETTSILDLYVAPVRLNLLGVRVDTSPINLTIKATSGEGQVLGNALNILTDLFNPPLPDRLTLGEINSRLRDLLDDLDVQLPEFEAAVSEVGEAGEGARRVLALAVPPIDLNLLGLNLQTDQIRVNADARTGDGELLGNVLTTLLNTLEATDEDLQELNNNLNAVLAKVIGVLNASNLSLADAAVEALEPVLQTLALPDLVNTSGEPATTPVLNLAIASPNDDTPPVDVDLLGLRITTSNVRAQLVATTGEGQVLGNLVYNVAHLLDPGGSLNLLTILGRLGL